MVHDGFTIPGAEPSYAPDLALEPVHCEVSLRFDIDAARASGSVTTTVRCNRPGARSLRLDAVALQDVHVTGPERWRYDGKAIELAWDAPFQAGEERRIEVRYTVQSPITGMRFLAPDEAYPQRAHLVYTDHETERARYWLPCVDFPTVRPTFDFRLTAPTDLAILANGVLESETEHGDGTKTAHWKLNHRCPSYLVCLAVGRFTRVEDEPVDGCPIEYYGSARLDPDDLRRSFGKTPAMMRWLVQRLGVPFPFRKYFQIALPEIGGAMENISLVTWDEWLALDEGLATEWGPRVDSINVHEMAHSYFGDAVVCRHFEHSWLKESWATYVESVWREETQSIDEAHYNLHVDAEAYVKEAESRYVRPIVTRTYNTSWDLFDQHLYPGGAWRLHMLRHLVGDEAFWDGTRDYLQEYSGKVVETEDFRRTLERRSGLNLVPFFDQWIHARGFPKLKATLKQDAEKGEASLVVEQTQENKEKEIGLFRFEIGIVYEDEDGAHAKTLHIDGQRTTAVFPIAGKCTQLRFDPDCKALFALEFNPGADMLRRSLRDGDVRNRIRAAQELIKTGERKNLAAVREAMEAEPFWGVRASVAAALGDSRQVEAVAALAGLLQVEREPRVQGALAAACGMMRDARLRAALLAFLGRTQGPVARGAALQSLGAQRQEQDLALLTAAVDGTHRLVAGGALRGLGALGSEAGFEFLETRLVYGAEPEDTRAVAAEAYGACATRLQRRLRLRARDRLVDLTRDPHARTRMAAGAALADLGDAAAIAALRGMQSLHPAEELPRIQRWITRLRNGSPGEEARKLREQLETLEQRCRKLDERVQDLEARAAD